MLLYQWMPFQSLFIVLQLGYNSQGLLWRGYWALVEADCPGCYWLCFYSDIKSSGLGKIVILWPDLILPLFGCCFIPVGFDFILWLLAKGVGNEMPGRKFWNTVRCEPWRYIIKCVFRYWRMKKKWKGLGRMGWGAPKEGGKDGILLGST